LHAVPCTVTHKNAHTHLVTHKNIRTNINCRSARAHTCTKSHAASFAYRRQAAARVTGHVAAHPRAGQEGARRGLPAPGQGTALESLAPGPGRGTGPGDVLGPAGPELAALRARGRGLGLDRRRLHRAGRGGLATCDRSNAKCSHKLTNDHTNYTCSHLEEPTCLRKQIHRRTNVKFCHAVCVPGTHGKQRAVTTLATAGADGTPHTR
jgi:hypothetical protein